MKNLFILAIVTTLLIGTSCKKDDTGIEFPDLITVEGIAQNPEGIEYNKDDHTFFLSSLSATPIIKVNLDGTYTSFTSGEPYPLSTAGLQIDHDRNRLLVAGFNGIEPFDGDPATKGISNLRIYNLETGVMESDINLSALAPDASSYFANDIAVDNDGNVYISDWFAGLIYKVDLDGTPSVFWTNSTSVAGGPNGLDFDDEGYLLVSVINDGTYTEHALVKIPVDDPNSATTVNISDSEFAGFDGMAINSEGNVVGVTNNGVTAGGNMLIELSGTNSWESAEVVNATAITTSTTVAVTAEGYNYVINQDFASDAATKETWTIERIKF